MVINEREFPVVVEAYQPSANGELFVAEQMVSNQIEADSFSSRYAGYVIKARVVKENELTTERRTPAKRTVIHRRGIPVWAILLLIVVVLVVVGFTTGWVQRTFDINLK
jgi:type VI protein secretion system component VasF